MTKVVEQRRDCSSASRSSECFSSSFIYLYALSDMNKASHILLRGVPITATSGDLRRAVMLAGVLGVTHGGLARNVTTSQI